MLKTGNFDMVGEISKRFLNRIIGILFYKGFLTINGVYKISSQDIPDALTEFTEIKYQVSLKEPPNVNLVENGKVLLLVNAEAEFIILGGLLLEFDVTFSVKADFSFDRVHNRFFVDLAKAAVDSIEINDSYELPHKVMSKFNEIVSIAVRENLADQYTVIDIPLVLYSQELPEMPEGDSYEMDIALGGVKTFQNDILAGAVNILKYNGGNISNVANFIQGKDLAVGISEKAMHRVFNFWWDNTTWSKSIEEDKTAEIDAVEDFLNFIEPVFSLAVTMASLGILETDYHVDRAWVDYGARVEFGKPEFDLKAGNIFKLSKFKVKVHVYATVRATVTAKLVVDTSPGIPDDWTPWEDDITISSRTSTAKFFDLSEDIEVNLNYAEGKVYLDDKNRIMGKLNDFDVSLSLGNDWYEHLLAAVLNTILDFVKNIVKGHIPPLALFPAVITKDIPKIDTPITLDLDVFDVYDDETIIATNVKFEEMSKTGLLAAFVANKNPDSLEVHRLGCEHVHEMNEGNIVAYYVLNDALEDGYDGCKYCLPEYHTR
jgi:hypothetical protein